MNIPGARRRSTRARKIPSNFPALALIAVLVLAAASMVALIVGVSRGGDATRGHGTAANGRLEQASLKESGTTSRSVFKHSVIPGGVFTPEELQSALAQDAVAAAHYRDLNTKAIHTETVKQERFAYVSYRKDDQIYWTRNKVRLSEGETILSDGTTQVRARCGNCISETARLPVADVEPDAAELDRLVDDPGNQESPSLSAAIRAALESSLFGSLGTGAGTAGSAASGSTGSAGMRSSGAGMAGGGGGAATKRAAPGASSPGSSGSSFDETPVSMSSADPASSVLDRGDMGPGASEGELPNSGSSSPASNHSTQPVGSPRAENAAPAGSPFVGGSTPGQLPDRTGNDPPSVVPPGVPSVVRPGSHPALPSMDPASPVSSPRLTESPSTVPVAGGEVPPGIDLPAGFDPANTTRTLATPPVSSVAGRDDKPGEQGAQAEVASIPEPGSLFLLGGGAALALLRRFRSSPRSR